MWLTRGQMSPVLALCCRGVLLGFHQKLKKTPAQREASAFSDGDPMELLICEGHTELRPDGSFVNLVLEQAQSSPTWNFSSPTNSATWNQLICLCFV